jgi:hypothetical protein
MVTVFYVNDNTAQSYTKKIIFPIMTYKMSEKAASKSDMEGKGTQMTQNTQIYANKYIFINLRRVAYFAFF